MTYSTHAPVRLTTRGVRVLISLLVVLMGAPLVLSISDLRERNREHLTNLTCNAMADGYSRPDVVAAYQTATRTSYMAASDAVGAIAATGCPEPTTPTLIIQAS